MAWPATEGILDWRLCLALPPGYPGHLLQARCRGVEPSARSMSGHEGMAWPRRGRSQPRCGERDGDHVPVLKHHLIPGQTVQRSALAALAWRADALTHLGGVYNYIRAFPPPVPFHPPGTGNRRGSAATRRLTACLPYGGCAETSSMTKAPHRHRRCSNGALLIQSKRNMTRNWQRVIIGSGQAQARLHRARAAR